MEAIGRIDLNADLGEEVTDDASLLSIVTSANIACGFHAGTVETMRVCCAGAAAHGVSIGAQVSYADREHFGRVPRDVPYDVLRDQVAEQVALLVAIAQEEGVRVRYVRPHGALYHRVRSDDEQARAVLAGAPGLPVLGLPDALLLRLAADEGRPVWREGFPDRAPAPDGGLAPRTDPGAVLTDSARIAARAVDLAGSVDSVCVHGDTPGAVAHAEAVRRALAAAGYELRGL